jgi:signal transduction histidine kinase
MSKLRHSLSRKLCFSLIALAVPMFILSLGIFFLQSRYLIRQEAMERSTSTLNTTLQRVINYMGTVETAARINAWLLEENFNPDSLQSISHRIVCRNPNVISCSIGAKPNAFPQCGHYFSVYTVDEGDTVVTTREPDYDYFDKTWYKSVMQSGTACWVDPFDDSVEGTVDHNEAVASYCLPLRPGGGPVAGVLSTDFSFARLAETLAATELPYPNAYFMLIGADGRCLIHPDDSRLFKKTIYEGIDANQSPAVIALGHEMTAGKQGILHLIIDGCYDHVCYSPVPGTSWSLALVCPDREILTSYNHLVYVIVVLILIGLLFITWLSFKVVRQTLHPINKLLAATQKIADGNYDEVLPLSGKKDLLARLQNSFAVMQQSIISKMGSIDRTTEEIRKNNVELESATKLAEESVKKKSLFIQNLLHQIRTPLNIIQGFADVLRGNIDSQDEDAPVQTQLQTEELHNITTIMKHNSVHLNRMVLMLFDSSETGISDMSHYQRYDEVSCNELARECIESSQSHFPGVEVHLDTKVPDSLCILTNHLYLMRTIRELLFNSAKYSDGKHVTLRITQTESTVHFIIEDVGPGLSEEMQSTLFVPFTKIDDISEGLGLGLPLTKHHAVSLGGDLIFDAEYKKGCRFVLEMPK